MPKKNAVCDLCEETGNQCKCLTCFTCRNKCHKKMSMSFGKMTLCFACGSQENIIEQIDRILSEGNQHEGVIRIPNEEYDDEIEEERIILDSDARELMIYHANNIRERGVSFIDFNLNDVPVKSLRGENNFFKNKFPFTMGCEIEIAQSAMHREKNDALHQFYRAICRTGSGIVYDGSLTSSGFEIVTPPLVGDSWEKSIEELCNSLKTFKRFSTTGHSSIHYHYGTDIKPIRWNVNVLSPRRIIYLGAAIPLLESALYYFGGRNPTRYSKSFTSEEIGSKFILTTSRLIHLFDDPILQKVTNDILYKIFAVALYGTTNFNSIARMTGSKYTPMRYFGVNFHSMPFRGTLEFRYGKGESNSDPIIALGRLYGAILKVFYTLPEEQIKDLILRSAKNMIAVNGDKRKELNQELNFVEELLGLAECDYKSILSVLKGRLYEEAPYTSVSNVRQLWLEALVEKKGVADLKGNGSWLSNMLDPDHGQAMEALRRAEQNYNRIRWRTNLQRTNLQTQTSDERVAAMRAWAFFDSSRD